MLSPPLSPLSEVESRPEDGRCMWGLLGYLASVLWCLLTRRAWILSLMEMINLMKNSLQALGTLKLLLAVYSCLFRCCRRSLLYSPTTTASFVDRQDIQDSEIILPFLFPEQLLVVSRMRLDRLRGKITFSSLFLSCK